MNRTKIIFLALSFGLIGCAGDPAPTTKEKKDVLVAKQLTRLSEQISLLQSDISAVREVVTALHREKVNIPTTSPAPAQPAVFEVPFDESPIMGSAKATVGIVEFTDYECPFCRRFHDQTFPRLKEKYIDMGKVVYVVRDYALPFHNEGRPAAIAANCAAKQDKFWDMNSELFSRQRDLGQATYLAAAKKIGIDVNSFAQCLNDQSIGQEVDQDQVIGQSLGVNGTPSFFIGRVEKGRLVNAKALSGAQPFSVFSRVIDQIGVDGKQH